MSVLYKLTENIEGMKITLVKDKRLKHHRGTTSLLLAAVNSEYRRKTSTETTSNFRTDAF